MPTPTPSNPPPPRHTRLTDPAVLALLRTLHTEPQKCQMQAFFDANKDSPFGGLRVAALVCNCPRCAGRATL